MFQKISVLGLGKVLLIACLVINAIGCNTFRHVRELEKATATEELEHLKKLESSIANGSYPPSDRHYSLFLSENIINSVLSGVDKYKLDVPEQPETIIEIESIRTHFRNGFPLLSVVASAKHVEWDLSV